MAAPSISSLQNQVKIISPGRRYLYMPKHEDLTNRRFGKLIVLRYYGRSGSRNKITWLCRCDCGNECIVMGESLRNGQTKSCGCITNYVDMVGKKYGKLTVIERAKNTSKIDRSACWLCSCECGNTAIVRGGALRLGRTLSCGCLVTQRKTEVNKDGRVCTKCNKYMLYTNFNKSKKDPTGFRSICKSCQRKEPLNIRETTGMELTRED
jgi:hypothetical protein